MLRWVLFMMAGLLVACSTSEEDSGEKMRQLNQKGEYIYRHHDEYLFNVASPEKQTPDSYPWEIGNSDKYPRITKEFFRCKGSILNPVRIVQNVGEEPQRFYDCGGSQKHSLPVREGKEFIFPVLIDLLNYLQQKTGKRIVITSGHRCPEHNSYADSSKENQYSKHMIGAEVSFYIQGMEETPELVVSLIKDFYKEASKHKGLKDFSDFQRYEKGDTNVVIQPWYNKEVFVKIFGKKEGRNFDNRHPYPYISIQVRFDTDLQEKVIYTWDKAFNSYMRH